MPTSENNNKESIQEAMLKSKLDERLSVGDNIHEQIYSEIDRVNEDKTERAANNHSKLQESEPIYGEINKKTKNASKKNDVMTKTDPEHAPLVPHKSKSLQRDLKSGFQVEQSSVLPKINHTSIKEKVASFVKSFTSMIGNMKDKIFPARGTYNVAAAEKARGIKHFNKAQKVNLMQPSDNNQKIDEKKISMVEKVEKQPSDSSRTFSR